MSFAEVTVLFRSCFLHICRFILYFFQAQPILICGDSDTELHKKAKYVLKVPQMVDCLQGILTVIPLQLLSFHIAVLKGYDVSHYNYCVRELNVQTYPHINVFD